MSKHVLNYHDLSNSTFEHEIASSCGRGENKSLRVSVYGEAVSYIVKSKGVVVAASPSLSGAVEAYNLI